MIDRETVDRIYAAANIVDIVGDYVTLKRKGVNYQACWASTSVSDAARAATP